MNKLLLVDGSALLHRAYHAYPPLTDREGEVVGAVFGVASMLISALDQEKPDYVVVAWDLPQPTFRHEKFVGYKAQRPKADAEMVEQIPKVKELIQEMGLTQLALPGFEADDIIGTLSRWTAKTEDLAAVILTGDQDTMQLVTDQVRVLTPPKGREPAKLYGPEEVQAKYGVTPRQIVDYKALVGDSSDNIPGVAGIGPKTAAQLLHIFGSLEEIYRQIERVASEVGETTAQKLAAGQDSAWLSQDLGRIRCDLELNAPIEEYRFTGLATEGSREALLTLGFQSLVRRIFPPSTPDKPAKVPDNQIGLF